jgi:hypothetical protein
MTGGLDTGKYYAGNNSIEEVENGGNNQQFG